MIYNLGINPGYMTSRATFQKVLNVYKNIITNKPITDADMPAFNAAYSQQIMGKYPTARPYTFVYQENDPAVTGNNAAYATLWFKKEHPLYPGHFLYIGLRFTSCPTPNLYNYFALNIDIAELVTEDGTIVNRLYGSISSYNGVNINAAPGGNSLYCNSAAVLNRGNYWYFNLFTLNISDFGLGLFRCDMSANPLNAAFSHYIGALFLETLATPATGGTTSKKLAFLPENYPMQALIWQNGSVNSGSAANQMLGMIRIPNLAGVDAQLTGSPLNSVIDSPIHKQPSAAGSVAYGQTLVPALGTTEIVNVNGDKVSELYPEYVRSGFSGTPLAKLPVLRPVQGGADYPHYGRAITVNTTENYVGIQALEDWEANITNSSANTYLQAMKALPYRQAYLRMD
ncbi:hypothetical protein KFS98_003686 [Salmonella enterica]|nr:hypothetical protein [Salmonella enterica]